MTLKYWQVVSWNDTEHMVEVARVAEQLGFEGVILAEHAVMPRSVESAYPYSADGASPMTDAMDFPDPLITFAAMAAVTEKLRFMTGIYLPGLRHPIVNAKEMATLARVSGDRFSLGIGSGWLKEEYEILGVDFHTRGRRLDECLDVMQALWQGNPVSHDGEFFSFEEIQIRPFPAKKIPIIGGGTSKPALRRSALRCDGWYGPGNNLEDLPDLLHHMRDLRESAGLSWASFQIIAPLLTPITLESAHQLEQLGVSGAVNYPFAFGCTPGAGLEEKCEYMRQFAYRLCDG